MNAMFAFCGIVIAGWVSPEFGEPIAPFPESTSVQPSRPEPPRPLASYPQLTGTRPARAVNQGAMRPQRMPVAPTDPRTYSSSDLPLPPTMNDSGMLPSGGMDGLGPRRDLAGPAENGNRRLPNQKPFDHYRPGPTTSPYQLLDSTTNNGTVNPYMAYVRPAEQQQQANQELDRAMNNSDDQPAPVYPRAFQNYGSYYPVYGAGR
ncbi:MAG: hypothetical protein ACLP9L_42660 [Thermoguttaceae bacterium]